MMSDDEFENSYTEERAPVSVISASRLNDDLDALMFFLEGSFTRRVPVRLASSRFVYY